MRKAIILVLVLSAILNVVFLSRLFLKKENIDEPRFLAKRIFIESPNDIIINFVDLRVKLREYIKTLDVKTGVYFEYLPNGTSMGVNEREVFFQASLIKVPTIMKIYKLIEAGKVTKDEELTIEARHIDPNYGQLWKKGEGVKITVEKAINLALVESDNTAFEVLKEIVEKGNNIPDVHDYLDIPQEPNAGITPKNYSSILKSLYFSAYLSYEHSNEILEFLAGSAYRDGIRSPIPPEVKVSNKFGIRSSGEEELLVHSDCGIFYLPERPYLLCVMINSAEEEKNLEHMREISRMVFEFVSSIK